MGWQDRDYAASPPRRPSWGSPAPLSGGGHSIVTKIIIANVIVYTVPRLFVSWYEPVYAYGQLQAGLVMRGQIWRLFTAMYLHASMGHIFVNMLGLHFLGRPLERLWSPRKFFTIYTLCGLAGNIFFTILGARGIIHPMAPAVGASGSIYGLLGVVAVMFPHATVYIYFLFPLKIRTAAYIFGGIAIFTIFERGSNFGGEACHLAGLVLGVWWAMKGEAWWARTQWRIPSMPSRPREKKSASSFQRKVKQRHDDADLIDDILRKVYEGGIHSLSEAEKRHLHEASQRQREREAGSGRVDRL